MEAKRTALVGLTPVATAESKLNAMGPTAH
jgi:hypothetical protein